MISLDKNYTTRSGTPVVIYAVYNQYDSPQTHGAIIFPHTAMQCTWTLNGCFYEDGCEDECGLDLVEIGQ
mgnify:CR=1 FL=1